MKCSNCGSNFRVDDARVEFEIHFNGIYYDTDSRGLCGDCAIDKKESWFSAMNAEHGLSSDDDD